MILLKVLQIPLFLCVVLLIKTSEAFRSLTSLPIDDKTLKELITPIILTAVLKEVRNRAEEHQEEEPDNDSSAQNQQPYFTPLSWQPLPNHPLVQHQPYHHREMLPLMQPLPLPFHHLAHHFPHLHAHPHAHVHQQLHPVAHPRPIAIIPHELIPSFFHQQVVARMIQQQQLPIINHQRIPGMHAIEIIEKLPLWIPSMPHANPMFHQQINYAPLLNHKIH